MARTVDPHPCLECGTTTTNPKTCSRICGMRYARNLRIDFGRDAIPARDRVLDKIPGERLLDGTWVPTAPKGECWEWHGTLDKGYAVISETVSPGVYKSVLAARVVWELFRKRSIPKGHVIGRTCKNGACCNIEHLRCGPEGKIKGAILQANQNHIRFGSANNFTKISDDHVRLLRKAYARGRQDLVDEIIKQLGVNWEYAMRIAKGQDRKWVTNLDTEKLSLDLMDHEETSRIGEDFANELTQTCNL